MKQTAVEWLREQYDNCPRYEENLTDGDFSKALEMEKEQAKRMYSEEEVFSLLEQSMKDCHLWELEEHYSGEYKNLTEWFEHSKKK
jgi:hypothetical protein